MTVLIYYIPYLEEVVTNNEAVTMTILDDLKIAFDETQDIQVNTKVDAIRRLDAVYAKLEPKYTREQIDRALLMVYAHLQFQ
jgi:hypothetical protein